MTHTAIRRSMSFFAVLALVCAFAGSPTSAQAEVKKQSGQTAKRPATTPKGLATKQAPKEQSNKKPSSRPAADDAASSLGSSMGF
jgi:hypothetical protein